MLVFLIEEMGDYEKSLTFGIMGAYLMRTDVGLRPASKLPKKIQTGDLLLE
jgi:hypothetical protein